MAAADAPWDALELVQQGTVLLKFKTRGDPHFREFRVSADLQYLTWDSPNKTSAKSRSASPTARTPGPSLLSF